MDIKLFNFVHFQNHLRISVQNNTPKSNDVRNMDSLALVFV